MSVLDYDVLSQMQNSSSSLKRPVDAKQFFNAASPIGCFTKIRNEWRNGTNTDFSIASGLATTLTVGTLAATGITAATVAATTSVIAPTMGNAATLIYGDGSNITGLSSGSGDALIALENSTGNRQAFLPSNISAQGLQQGYTEADWYLAVSGGTVTAGDTTFTLTNTDNLINIPYPSTYILRDALATAGGKQEFINITGVTYGSGTASVTLAAGTANSYTAAQVATSTGEIVGTTFTGDDTTAATHEAYNTFYRIDKARLRQAVDSGKVDISWEWRDKSFFVASFVSDVQLTFAGDANDAALIKSGSQFILHTVDKDGETYTSPRSPTLDNNFVILTASGDASHSAGVITVSHNSCAVYGTGEDTATFNEFGASTLKWKIIPYSVQKEVSVSTNATAETYAAVTPTIILPRKQGITYPSYVHSHWKLNELSGNAINSRQPSGAYDLTQVGTVPSTTGKLGNARGSFSAGNYFVTDASLYKTNNIFGFDFWFKGSTPATTQTLIASVQSGTSDGISIYLESSTIRFRIESGVITGSSHYQDGLWHHCFVGRINTAANGARIYIDGGVNVTGTLSATLSTSNSLYVGITPANNLPYLGILDSIAYWSTMPATWAEVEAIIAKRYAAGVGAEYEMYPGYTSRGSVDSLTGDKLGVKTKIISTSRAASIPVEYAYNAVLL